MNQGEFHHKQNENSDEDQSSRNHAEYACVQIFDDALGIYVMPLVFTQDRIVFIDDSNNDYNVETQGDLKNALNAAKKRIRELYPNAEIVTESQFIKEYSQYYHVPHPRYSLDTEYLCACGDRLWLDKRSLNAGEGVYGNPWHKWYHCFSCARQYVVEIQQRQYGVSEEWAVRLSDNDKFKDIEQPQLNRVNPYGLHETILIKNKEK